MSLQHRWLAISLALAVGFPFSLPGPTHAEPEGSGAIGLRELIVLALQNDPGLVALRNNIPVEVARKRAAVQWRDPEIRIGYSKDDNVQIDQPYTRSGSITETIASNSTSNTVGGRTGTDTQTGGSNQSGSTSQFGTSSQSGRSNETRTTSYTERVIPGAESDRIIRTETERRSTESSSTERRNESELRRSDGSAATQKDSSSVGNERSSSSEVYRRTSDETRYHGRNIYARDESTSVAVRFWIPKPWEKTALINQAAKRVDLANYEITAAERRVILEVRAQYEELQYLFKKIEADRRQIGIIEQHVANEETLLDAGGTFTLDQLSFEDLKIPGIKLAIDAAETELDAAKRALAARVGLADGSRIRVTDKLLRSGIDLQGADLDYLTRMSFAHRSEVGILQHEQAIAEAELEVVKSKRIPWFSFIEAGYAQDAMGGSHTNDNYGVQVGVVLPLFSWLAKDKEVVEARIDSYYASLNANQKSIANEVAEAFRSVKEATSYRSRTEAAVEQHSRAMAERAKILEASEDLAAKEELRYDAKIEANKLYQYILVADRLFNQSLIRLEQALGADLDQVFKVEFEPLARADSPVVVNNEMVPAAAQPVAAKRSLIRATPVAVKLQPEPEPGNEAAKPERETLFEFLKRKRRGKTTREAE
jgi:outer membrane protein TolC